MSKGRGTLGSFSFGSYKGVNELPEDVVLLFSEMADKPTKGIMHVEEIINAGLEGRIDFNSEFKLEAYDYTITNNLRLNVEKERKKKTFINFGGSDMETEQALRKGGISIDVVSSSASVIEDMRDAFEEVLDDSELKYAISTIKSLNEDFIVDFNVDLITLIKRSVLGIPQAISKLKEVCQDFSIVSEQVEIILKSGHDIEKCFAM